MNDPSNPSAQPDDAAPDDDQEGGCSGWAQAIIAISLLVLMVFFITCAVGTWYLYQQRGEMALATMKGALIPHLEQSSLDPAEKAATIGELQRFMRRAREEQLEPWQVAGVMQRLYRAPLLSWGDLQRTAAIIRDRETIGEDGRNDAQRDISRLMRGAELGEVTQLDMLSIFEPISSKENNEAGYTLIDQPSDAALAEFIHRVGLVAKRADVPEKTYEVQLADVVRRLIDAGTTDGMQ